jgi:hypothetical protein
MPQKTLVLPADRDEVLARIAHLRADSPPQWGKMNAAQMLAHCQVPLRVATGEQTIRRGLVGILFGGLARKSLTKPEPFGKNLPTEKTFRVLDARDCDRERAALTALVRAFGERGAAGLTKEPHPFFGKLETWEWEALMWKHLDHHLRQFAV